MGATLEFTRVKATNFRGAIAQLQEQTMSSDPYSGDFNTCSDYYNITIKHDSVDSFADWVEDEGEKREAYFYRYDKERWIIGAWCAC